MTNHVRVSVLIPTFNNAIFINRALGSLLGQTFKDFEGLIIDDGSTDDTRHLMQQLLRDPRLRYERLATNQGLGKALNVALDKARGEFIAYLPADDFYFPQHLECLLSAITNSSSNVACSGMRYRYKKTSFGPQDQIPMQLVQVMHRRTAQRWTERKEFVTDDLDRLFWSKLGVVEQGIAQTLQVTCEWVDHPYQHHKIIQEPFGGLPRYRAFYQVPDLLHFRSSVGQEFDERKLYGRFHERVSAPNPEGLKILLVGELAYNAERILAFEEAGHSLYGLWIDEPFCYNTVGTLPFAHVKDLDRKNWKAEIAEIKPDIIYALLNWQCVPLAYSVLKADTGIPFVWHLKEGPFTCMEFGSWSNVVELYARSDGQIYCNEEIREWFKQALPQLDFKNSLVLDGDLPKADWFLGERTPKLSSIDGEVHTMVPGRPVGLEPGHVAELARAGIHLHFYSEFKQGEGKKWWKETFRLAPKHAHLHPSVQQDRWLQEFSQYDAGWLHTFKSKNKGDLRSATWDDLNLPARIGTLAAAGLPFIQRDNSGCIVAMQNLSKKLGAGVFYDTPEDLAQKLKDKPNLKGVEDKLWGNRLSLAFDTHVDKLIRFFQKVIDARRSKGRPIAKALPAKSLGERKVEGEQL